MDQPLFFIDTNPDDEIKGKERDELLNLKLFTEPNQDVDIDDNFLFVLYHQ